MSPDPHLIPGASPSPGGLALQDLVPTQGPPGPCTSEPDSLCKGVFDVTHSEWLAFSSNWLIAIPLQVLTIVVVAYVARALVHRAILRMTAGNGDPTKGKKPALLRPLREKRNEHNGAQLAERRRQRAQTLGSVLRSIASFVIYGLAGVYILKVFNVDLAPLVASAGVAGVAVGFGAQNLVRDFLSGMFMMIEDQYGVGDWVDLGEASGTVESVGLRVTTLRDMGGTVWYVRNGEVQRVGNSSQGFAVAVVDLPVSHTTNLATAVETAGRLAVEAASQAPLSADVLEPPDMLGADEITPDTITLRLTAKVRPGKQWAVQRALRAAMKRAYERDDVHPPYPEGRPHLWSAEQQQ